MPRFVSNEGVWFPGKEKVALVNRSNKTRTVNGKKVKPGEPYIYDGADRAALFMLHEQNVETLGSNFRGNPDLVQRVRQLGFENMDAYLNFMGYDKEKSEENFKRNVAVITKHELEQGVKMINRLGGGQDFTGQGQDKLGGFGRQPDNG